MSCETVCSTPVRGYEAKSLDFNKILVTNPPETVVMRMNSTELMHKGIYPGAYLVVDRSKKLETGKIVAFSHDGEFHCREFVHADSRSFFIDEWGDELPLSARMIIFGVVTREMRYL